jgi:hypothetical protein
MKKNIYYKIIIVVIISFLLFIFTNFVLYLSSKYKCENFLDNDSKYDIFTISLRHNNRIENINKQQEKLNKKIEIFDAVKGDKLNLNELIKQQILSPTANLDTNEIKKKRQIGCYLSHYNIYKTIKNDNRYTIIFEDDLIIKTDNLLNKINEILKILNDKNIDFDILYLGNLKNNHGKQIQDNIYEVDLKTDLWGLHGYLINNKNINNIINETKIIDMPIDNRIFESIKENKIKSIVIYPNLIEQGGASTSTINDLNIENFIIKQ